MSDGARYRLYSPPLTWWHGAAIAALAGLVALSIFIDLGRPHLWDPGEGRYAETVREMLLTGNWLVPTLNFVSYYDKPPGFFWLVALAFQYAGVSEWAARLPAAIAAVLTILATVVFGWRRLGPPAALGAGAVLATTTFFVVLARAVRMDMVLTLAVTGTLFYAYSLWETDETRDASSARRPPTWPLYLLSALGVLVKGPIAVVLPVLALAALAATTGHTARLRRLRPGVGAIAALVLAGSWYAFAAFRAPEYLWVFLWLQNVGRFLTGEPGSGHSEPIWFFFWVLPLTFLPWTLFLPAALRRGVERAREGYELERFLLAWPLVVFVFFTLSRAKLATYMLPAFPPLALLIAGYVARVLRSPVPAAARAFEIPALLWTAAMAIAMIGTAAGVAIRYPGYAAQGALALVLLVFPLAGVWMMRSRRWRLFPALVLIATLATQMLFYRAGADVVNEFSSLHDAADAARELPRGARVFAYKTRGHSFTFYGGRTLKRVRSPEAAAAALDGHEPAGLLTKTKYLERIQQHLAEPVCVWWQGPSGRVFLANRPAPDTLRHATLPPLLPSRQAGITLDRRPRC